MQSSVPRRLGLWIERVAAEPRESGLIAVFRKELADQLGGIRVLIMGLLIVLTTVGSLYVAARTIQDNVGSGRFDQFVFLRLFTTSDGTLPSFVFFLGFLAPLLGLAMGFDAINGEENRRTLSRLVAQPIHRDAVINGKFLAGSAVLAILFGVLSLLVAGLGLRLIGVPPSGDEVARLLAFYALTVLYSAFWLSLSILFSVWFRQASTSALAGIAVWLFFALFGGVMAQMLANAVVPVDAGASLADQLRNANLQLWLSRLSPSYLYTEATLTLLNPASRSVGLLLPTDLIGAVPGHLPFGQSLLLIWPHVAGLIGGILAVFSAAYIKFMRREIRA